MHPRHLARLMRVCFREKYSFDVLAVPGSLADVLPEMINVTVKDLFGDAQELLPKKDSMFLSLLTAK